MESADTLLHDVVRDIGEIVTRDGGALEFDSFDSATGTLVVNFTQATDEECSDCIVDEPTVRMFLEEAVRAQGVQLSTLQVRNVLAAPLLKVAPDAARQIHRLEVHNPTADDYGKVSTEAVTRAGSGSGLAVRPTDLTGLTVGLLWNGKPMGDMALRSIGAELEAQFTGLTTRFYSGSIPCDRAILDQVIAECSVVVAMTADCGSCSSWITHDSIALERAGIPTVIVASKGFEEDIEASARAFALKDVQTVVVPFVYNNATEEVARSQSVAAVPAVIHLLQGGVVAHTEAEEKESPAVISFQAADPVALFADFNKYFMDRDWGDGYPLVPPTEAAVAKLLKDVPTPRHEVLFTLAPGNGQVTPEKIAIVSAMAGCTAAEMIVVEAVLRAFDDPKHKMRIHTTLMSTSSHAPFVLVNGPFARSIGVNGGRACVGPGAQNQVNLRIGRAVTLALKNLGSWYPGVMDMDTIGSVRKNVIVITENEAESPWDSLQVDAGYDSEANTVSLFMTLGESDIGFQGHLDPRQLARSISSFDGVQGGYFSNLFGGEKAKDSPNGRLLLLAPPHANALAEGGITKEAFRSMLFEDGHVSIQRLTESWRKLHLDGKTLPEWDWMFELSDEEKRTQTMPVVRDQDQYFVVVCGSTRGKDLLMPTACPPCTAPLRADWISPETSARVSAGSPQEVVHSN